MAPSGRSYLTLKFCTAQSSWPACRSTSSLVPPASKQVEPRVGQEQGHVVEVGFVALVVPEAELLSGERRQRS